MLSTTPLRAPVVRALLLLAALAGAPWQAAAQGAPTSFQGPILPDPTLRALEVRPVWRDKLDAPTAVVGGDAVIYLREGRLVATELATGWQHWSYGGGLSGPLARVDDLVLVAEGEGAVTALDVRTGQRAWSVFAASAPVYRFAVREDAVLAASPSGAVVLDPASGEVRYALEATGRLEPVHFGADQTIVRSTQGEPQQTSFLSFDPETGEQRWRVSGARALLEVGEGRVRFYAPPGLGAAGPGAAAFTVTTHDSRTGEQLESWEYRFDTAAPAFVNRAFLSDDSIWVVSANERELHRFPVGGAAAPTATYRGLLGGEFRLGPYLGRLLFEADDGALWASAQEGPLVTPYLPTGARLSRLDIDGGRLYAGRVDGTFLAVDLSTARSRYLLTTGGHGFGPTLNAGAYVVVQGDAEIFVVEDTE